MSRSTSVLILTAFLATSAFAQEPSTGSRMIGAATALQAKLTDKQKSKCMFAYDDKERLNWHFIPRERNGISFRELEAEAAQAGRALVASGLSTSGYEKALKVMSLEEVLYLIEGGNEAERRNKRHPHKYAISIFGKPGANSKWGWRVEGHHLSLNYTIDAGKIVASTPEFFGANPGSIAAGPGRSLRVLGKREDLGRSLLKSLNDDQKKVAWLSKKAPKDIRDGGKAQPDVGEPQGLTFAKMTPGQQANLREILGSYLEACPREVAKARLNAIEKGGMGKIHFAWSGGSELNEPHHYRIQGPTFVVEYNNTQNKANHVHSIWRNVSGDFGVSR